MTLIRAILLAGMIASTVAGFCFIALGEPFSGLALLLGCIVLLGIDERLFPQ